MIARRSVWSDPNVVELIQNFVPVADEVARLQRGSDPEARLFQTIAEQGHYAGYGPPKHTGTRQGTYAAAPSGVLLASINSNNPEKMADMLRRALEKWRSLPRQERLLAQDPQAVAQEAARARAERLYPEGGLVFRVDTRDLPRNDNTQEPNDWRANAVNQDFAWFTKDEACRFVPENPAVGQAHEVPEPLIHRLARLHFLDNVRGQTIEYGDEDVKTARLTGTVTGVVGSRVSLRLDGEVRLSAEGTWPVNDRHDADNPRPHQRGFHGRLLGYATWDNEKQRFVVFEMVAAGTRWGATQYNVRHGDHAPAPLGFALTLAGDTPRERVAPAEFWHYGWR